MSMRESRTCFAQTAYKSTTGVCVHCARKSIVHRRRRRLNVYILCASTHVSQCATIQLCFIFSIVFAFGGRAAVIYCVSLFILNCVLAVRVRLGNCIEWNRRKLSRTLHMSVLSIYSDVCGSSSGRCSQSIRVQHNCHFHSCMHLLTQVFRTPFLSHLCAMRLHECVFTNYGCRRYSVAIIVGRIFIR